MNLWEWFNVDVDPISNTKLEIVAHLATIFSSSVLVISVFWFGIYLATDGKAHGDLTRDNAMILHELKRCVEDGVCSVYIEPPQALKQRHHNVVPHAVQE